MRHVLRSWLDRGHCMRHLRAHGALHHMWRHWRDLERGRRLLRQAQERKGLLTPPPIVARGRHRGSDSDTSVALPSRAAPPAPLARRALFREGAPAGGRTSSTGPRSRVAATIRRSLHRPSTENSTRVPPPTLVRYHAA